MSKVLFDEHPIVISPKLARIFGLEAAVFLQQIHYWAEHKRADPKRYSGSFHSGHAWVYKTHAEWLEEMPFLGSRRTFQRMIKTLKESLVLVVENHNQWEHDNTPWYRINYQVLEKLTEEHQVKMTRPRVKMTPPPGQNDTAPRVKMTPPPGQNDPSITRDYTETTKPETTQREGECARGAQTPTPKPKSAVAASAVKNAVKEEEALKADFESVPATVAADDPEDRRQALNALSTVPGFAVNRAQELVKIRSLVDIQQQVEALPYRSKAKDPARVLYMAIKRRWSLPEAYLQRNSAPPPDVDLSAVAERLMSAAALITSQGQRLVVKHVNMAAQAVRVLLNGTEAVLTFDQALRCEIECSPA